MKVIQMLQECSLGTEKDPRILKKDKFYIMSDSVCRHISIVYPGLIGIEIPFKEVYNEYKDQDLNNKRILMIRHGGGGDILFMTTGIRELYRKFPRAKISVAISEQYKGIVNNEKEIEASFNLPISLDDWNNFHYHLSFENLIENNPEATRYNAYDLFMKKMGLNIKEVPPENKIPSIKINQEEKNEIKEEMISLNSPKKKIGLQLTTSTPIRNFPIYKFEAVINALINKGHDIYVFGSLAQENIIKSVVSKIGLGVFNVSNNDLRRSIVLASLMDYFIAPDSMFIHIAAALNKPVLGIYGPFHSELRMKYFKKSTGIDVKVGCSPCFLHSRHPCPKGDPSPCFSIITPEIVVEQFLKMEENYERNA